MDKARLSIQHRSWGLIIIHIAVALVTALGILLSHTIGGLNHIFLYLIVVIGAALGWGLWLAFYTLILSIMLVDFFFVPPIGTLNLDFAIYNYSAELVGLVIFLILSSSTIYLLFALRRERDRARVLAKLEREERERLARDLHDGLAQAINYIGLKAQLIQELCMAGEIPQISTEIGQVAKVAELARTNMREALYGLRHTTQDRSLLLALTDLVQSMADLSGIKISLETSDRTQWPALSAVTHVHLLRIVQEALYNVQKHSQAQQAQVGVWYFPATQSIHISIKDDGIGFVPDQVRSSKAGQQLGLNIMRERAARLAAELQISSEPASGTEVMLKYQTKKE
jgi:signal transduction histidine kinase